MTIKVVKRVKTGRFQNSLRSQILFNDTFYFGYVVDCYLEIFTTNIVNSKYINIRAQSMERYNCNIKIKRIYSNTPVNIITDGPILESSMRICDGYVTLYVLFRI